MRQRLVNFVGERSDWTCVCVGHIHIRCTPVPWLGLLAEVCHNQKDNAPHNANFRCHSNDRWWGWRGLTNMAALWSEVRRAESPNYPQPLPTEDATTTAPHRLLLNQIPGPGATGVACTSRSGQRLSCPTCSPQILLRLLGECQEASCARQCSSTASMCTTGPGYAAGTESSTTRAGGSGETRTGFYHLLEAQLLAGVAFCHRGTYGLCPLIGCLHRH